MNLPVRLKMNWMAMSCDIQRGNSLILERTRELRRLFAEDGYRSTVLKGVGCQPIILILLFVSVGIGSFENHTITLDFPLYRELIDGTDKKEADIELYQQLQQRVSRSYQLQEESVEESVLTRKEKDIYIRQGTVFMIPSLSSDRYYTRSNQNLFVPVFQYEYPVYSMNNLFLTYNHGRDKQLLLTHRQYGHFTPEISLPLLDFLAQFKDDFEPACHTALTAKGELETIVVFFHKTLNYIHLLKVHISPEDLFSSHPVLKADFYSNIPQHYINSLLR